MSLEIVERWAKEKDTPEGTFTLTWREIILLKDFAEWLDQQRGLTDQERAADG